MKSLEERDYFSDHSILKNPYAYFEAIRSKGPIYQLPDSGIVVVTGFEETLEILRDTEHFSSVIGPQGPAAPLPFEPQGADITAQIEAHRTQFLGGDLLVAYDDRQHSMSRSLLSRLFTPSRLKANEEFIAEYSDQLVQEAAANGGCELIKQIATPFVTMVIADLLGVPAEDRQLFMDAIDAGPPPGSLNSDDLMATAQPLVIMGMHFIKYVQERREKPRADILSELSNATYPDGTIPEALEIVRLATFLFGAGQDTSAKLLGNTMKFIVDEPGLQQRLRKDPALIPQLLEEVLRLEGFDRPRIKEHLAFGRGAHVCAGAPLARVEVRVILEKFLQHTTAIDVDQEKHGPPGNRNYDYESSFIIRGLSAMHLKMTAAAGASVAKEAQPRSGFFNRGAQTEKAAAATRYSTADTKIGVLLTEPTTKAVLDKYFPGVSSDKRIGMAKGMTLRVIQKFAPDLFTTTALDAADKELEQLPYRE
jgi:cytochrome P450